MLTNLKLAEVDGRENPKINGGKERDKKGNSSTNQKTFETESDTEDDDGKPTIVG